VHFDPELPDTSSRCLLDEVNLSEFELLDGVRIAQTAFAAAGYYLSWSCMMVVASDLSKYPGHGWYGRQQTRLLGESSHSGFVDGPKSTLVDWSARGPTWYILQCAQIAALACMGRSKHGF
jgi:hypothetical protein